MKLTSSRLIETSIDDVLNMKIGSQIDWKFGLITRTIVRIDEDIWEIHETSGRWESAEVNREQLIQFMSGSCLDKDLVEQRCKRVLEYLFPNYEIQMTAKQYNNAMEALRSIAFGTPVGKNYR